MTASQALVQYKGRDISKKLFQADKTFICSKSKPIQSSQGMSAKIFIEFVAMIVRNRIYNLLKEQMLRMISVTPWQQVSLSWTMRCRSMARKKSAETIDDEIAKVMADMSKLQDR